MADILQRTHFLNDHQRKEQFPEDKFYSAAIGEPRIISANGVYKRRCIYTLYAEKSAITLEKWNTAVMLENESNDKTGPIGV
jgi:hypothetical protein